MSIRVIHVVESKHPMPGTIAVCLPGLLESLRSSQVDGVMADSTQEWESEYVSCPIVHIHGWGYPLALHAAKAAKRAGKPYILSPLGKLTPGDFNRQAFFDRLRNWFAERSLIQGAAALTALNDVDFQSLRAKRPNSNIVMLPYGLNFADYEHGSATVTPSNRRRGFLMLGPLDPALGCVVLLKAIAE